MEKESELTRPLVHADLDDGDSSIDEYPLIQDRQKPRAIMRVAFGLFVLFAGAALFIAGLLVGSQVNFEARCETYASRWSPLLRDVNVRHSKVKYDGKFHDENIFRQSPSPEVDAAWEGLGVDYRAGVISYEDGLASGLEPSFVQRSAAHGGGFLVNVEGMHHLHCLNLVRKSLYFNHKYYEDMGSHEFKNNGSMLEHHITHCLDTVRQVLMCNVDTAVLGQRWVDPEKPYGFPDFQTTHKCKNYEDIRRWAEKLQSPPNDELPMDYLALPKPGDIMDVPP